MDIVEIGRMDKILQRSPRFAYRVFTDGERAYCEGHHRPAVRYATHFAAKEAVLKALGTGFGDGIAFTDVEVTHDDKGKPLALLHGRARAIADSLGILEIPLSLSRTNETAVANAIAVTAATRPVVEEKTTPAQELAMRFRELRSMLDDLEQDMDQVVEEADGTHE
ncbi:MAG: holo-ACP synthase [Coriobacteriales bacterium]